MPKIDAVGLEGMKGQIRTYFSEINLDAVTRKDHNKILYEVSHLFRSLRSIQHKKVLVK